MLLLVAEVGLEGRQLKDAAMPTGGEHLPGAIEGSALLHEVTMDEAVEVVGLVRSVWTLLEGGHSKSLRSSEGILR